MTDIINMEEIEEVTGMIIKALDLRYDAWRSNALKKKVSSGIIETMDDTHQTAIEYIKGMLILGGPDIGQEDAH